MLMVGALQCRNTVGPANEAYNAFVAQQHGVLDSKGYVLKGHFLRENGVAGGRAAYDQYNTAMSNRHAGRFDDPSFCATIATYTRMAATASDRDFVTLAQSVIDAPASSCSPAAFAAPPPPLPPVARRPEPLPPREPVAVATDDPYAGEVIAEPRAEPAVLAAAAAAEAVAPRAAEPLPAVAAPAIEPPVAAPAVAHVAPAVAAPAVAYVAPHRVAPALPTTVIAAAPVVPPEEAKATPSPAAALEAAIVALQAAAAALRQAGPTS